MCDLWAIWATGKLTDFGRKFEYLIDQGYEYDLASSKIVEVSTTLAGGK